VVSLLTASVILFALFVLIERRHSHPLVPIRLFRSRALTGANLIMVMIGAVMFSLFFFLSQFLQDVQGYSPLKAGFAFLPMPLALIIGTQLSSRLLGRVSARTLLVVGPLVGALGLVLLSRIHPDSSYLLDVGVPGALISFGLGTSLVPLTISANTGVERRDAGLASGLINTTRQIGGSLGLAVLVAIAASRTAALAGSSSAVADTAGYARTFAISALFLVAAAALAFVLLAKPRPTRSEPLVEDVVILQDSPAVN
jgi:predicted MFS family arabinose efflux permease